MLATCVLIVAFIAQGGGQEEGPGGGGPYRGKLVGSLSSYHHQVSGDVYAVDEWTLLVVNFNYDGAGHDTFFWAGDAGRPGPQGFIVPDERGKTNILERYYNADVRLSLPEGKRVSRLKWVAVYDIGSQNTFGDAYVPDDFEAPAPRALAPLAPHAGVTAHVSSQPVQMLDAATLLIPEFRYDGSGEEVYFWTGVGPQASARGDKLPDDYGYLEPLRAYSGEDVRLSLGARTVFDVNWLAVFDAGAQRVLAAVLLPDAPNVPPALTDVHPYKSALPHCRQLHRDLQVSWEVFGSQVTVQLAGQVGVDDYMAFGISGEARASRMVGADVAVASYEPRLQQGRAPDYNITAQAPCVQVLGAWRGVCRDERAGGLDSNQVLAAARQDGLTTVTYRRSLQPMEAMDREWATGAPLAVVWALGPLDADGEPAFHRLYPRQDVLLRLDPPTPTSDCVPFTVGGRDAPPAWEVAELFDPALRVFHFRLGPAGGRRGLAGRAGAGGGGGGAAPERAWYVNGQLAPDLQLRRGLQYTFKVYGGSDPHSARDYHPLVVGAEARGGLERLGDKAQRAAAAKLLAGAQRTRRGRLAPTAAGGLCAAEHAPGADRRRDDDYVTFRQFNRSLVWRCDAAVPAELTLAPNSSWPDIVYYNSFTHAGMGGRIYVVDRHRRNLGRRAPTAAAPTRARAPALAATLALALAAMGAAGAWAPHT